MAIGDGTINKGEPIYFGIPKKALGAWLALCEGQDNNPSYPCKNNPYFYMDYDGNGFVDEEYGDSIRRRLSEDDCEALCADCPLLKLCYDFAVASDQDYGIWGGIDFAAESESREGKLFS